MNSPTKTAAYTDRFLSTLFSSRDISGFRSCRITGLFGLLIFALGLSFGKSLQLMGLGVMLAGIIMDHRSFFSSARNSAAIWLVLLFLVYVWLRTFAAIFVEGDLEASRLADGARKYSYMAIIPVLAWWFRGGEKSVMNFFVITALSTAVYILLFSGISLTEFTMGRAMVLDLPTLIIAYSMFLSLILFWMVVYFRTIPSAYGNTFAKKAVITCLWIICFMVITITLVALEARASWGALILCVIIVSPFLIIKALRKKNRLTTRKSAGLFAVLFLSGLVLVVLGAFTAATSRLAENDQAFYQLKYRIQGDIQVLKHLMNQGDLEDTPITSLGERIYMWAEAAELIREKPLFGHGRGAVIEIPAAGKPPGTMRPSPHFHNTIIEALVAWGVAGTALMLAVFITMLMNIHKAWKNKRMSLEMYLFLMGGALLVAASGMTHSLGVRQTTWTYAALWAGPAFSYCFKTRLTDQG